MYVLYGSFELHESENETTEKQIERRGKKIPLVNKIAWHFVFSALLILRIAILIVQVDRVKNIEPVAVWAYTTMGLNIVHVCVGIGCLCGIVILSWRNKSKVRKS